MPIRKRSGEDFTTHCPLLSCNKSGTTTGRRTDRWQWQHQWIGDRPQGLVPVPTTTFRTINNNSMVPAGDASNFGRFGETFLFCARFTFYRVQSHHKTHQASTKSSSLGATFCRCIPSSLMLSRLFSRSYLDSISDSELPTLSAINLIRAPFSRL